MPIDDPEASPQHELADRLGVEFVPELLGLALTHRSYAFEHPGVPHNERLEFLGDSILGQAVTVMLFREHPDLDEGQLAKRRAALVSTVALAEIARGVGIGGYLHLGRGERMTGGSDKDSILADATEAIIGAAFLSAGGDAATRLVMRLIEPLRDQADRFGAALDPKTSLQERAAEHGANAPVYAVTGSGPDHDRRYTAVVTVTRDGETLASASGRGTSKKVAEMAAALDAWTRLGPAG
ncbi:MAG: ribonuclease III [Pseudoclavibacter sp.]|nr:ribonuclease III [Pseudoclavibacter sp.]